MSFMDTLKDKLGMSKDRSNDITRRHGDDDSQTGGKQGEQMDPGTDKAKDPMDEQDRGDGPA